MKLLMLVNPLAGRRHGIKIAHETRAIFKTLGIDVQIGCSRHVRHLAAIAEMEVDNGWDGIVALGGDGTVFEVVNGMMRGNPRPKIPLGIIPVGSGNSFVRDLGIRRREDAIRKIAAGKTRPVDLGRCDCDDQTIYFINILGFGFVADVALRAARFKRWGDFSYLIGVFFETLRLAPCPLEFEIDGQCFRRDNVFVEICNSTKTGGNMIMAPHARIDDGLLDVVLLNRIGRPRLLSALPRIFNGTHLRLPEVETFTGRTMRFRPARPQSLTPDGEIVGQTPITVTVLPGRVQVFDA
ncbi:diacylglycerol/lipid kinase family protein [Desulfatitalea tepidiphila]|uniref:diacylglycerol/lipid kinase family protein n=1 Tax=Desulfatitalea tepidiphila TaxID=1185843 RepID=UPI0006B4AB23|nr:diacylglycerol kinase family protein [Desulfatitalea tepidiphila]